MRIWSNRDWVGCLIVAWTVLVAGALIVLEVWIAESPDDPYLTNTSLEIFVGIIAVAVWMIVLFLGWVVLTIAAVLVDFTRERIAKSSADADLV